MTTTQEETKDLPRSETDSPESESNQATPENNLSAEEVLLLQEMAEAGLLYGLSKAKTHPKMKPWIFATRSGVEIINLENTVKELGKTAAILKSISSAGKQIMIVGTSPSVKMAAKEFGAELNQPFVSERWLGGTLTNFRIIENRIKYYNKLIADRESGALNKYTKKERVLFDKKLEKMKTFFEGISNMTGLPGAVLILDIQANKTAAREARGMNIPVIALVNTDTDPNIVDYAIPANNRLGEGIRWIMNHLKDSLKKVQVIAPAPDKKE
jgi:small subunit ribosomal protein S2